MLNPNPGPTPDRYETDEPCVLPVRPPTDRQRRLMRVVTVLQAATAEWVADDSSRLDLLRRFRSTGGGLAETEDAGLAEYASTMRTAVARGTGEPLSAALLACLLTTRPFPGLILPVSPR